MSRRSPRRATSTARRVLAVLECRPSDNAVRERAVELATGSGGYLTLVAVVPRPFPWVGAGPFCAPRVTPEQLREDAANALARAVALIPPDIPLTAEVEEGRASSVVRRRVEVAAHDAVVVGSHRRRLAQSVPVPVLQERGPCSNRT
jgi:nucleotide-binding universal stress UspA family protein